VKSQTVEPTILDYSTFEAIYTESSEDINFYVNDDIAEPGFAAGDDANDGTSPLTPMRHIPALLERYPGMSYGCYVRLSAGIFEGSIYLGEGNEGLSILGAGRDLSIIHPSTSGGQGGDAIGRPLTLQGTGAILIQGVTFENGAADMGGGIYCGDTDATFIDVVVRNCSASGSGGGIYCSGGLPWMEKVAVRDCHASGFGGGMAIEQSELLGLGCEITGNHADAGGGGIGSYNYGTLYLYNMLIAGNSTDGDGGGVGCDFYVALDSSTIADNSAQKSGGGVYLGGPLGGSNLQGSILWGNSAPLAGPQVAENCWDPSAYPAYLQVDYCDVEGGVADVWAPKADSLIWDPHNIDADPLFVGGGDYHEKSQAGHWTKDGWVLDDVTSPCIDKGPPYAYDQEPQPNGGRLNMGAYGNTPEASKSPGYLLVTVRSMPKKGAWITGAWACRTDASRYLRANSRVKLIAPATFRVGGRTYKFSRWAVGRVSWPFGVRTLSFRLNGSKIAVAKYKEVR
jgi:hypothetical protein